MGYLNAKDSHDDDDDKRGMYYMYSKSVKHINLILLITQRVGNWSTESLGNFYKVKASKPDWKAGSLGSWFVFLIIRP